MTMQWVKRAALPTTRRRWLPILGLLCCLGCSPASESSQAKTGAAGNTTRSDPATLTAETAASAAARRQSIEQGVQQQERDFESQLQTVLAGETDRIQLERTVVGDRQLQRGVLESLEPGLTGSEIPLRELLLDAGRISDAGMPAIARLRQLEHLRLRHSPITDAGLEPLIADSDSALRILNLPQAHLTAAGIERLAELPQLIQLRLGGESLDDRAMQAIARLPRLRSLHLIAPAITDVGLDHLAESPRLASLYIDDCPLSDAAWERLFEAKPKLHVHIDQHHHDRDPNRHPH